LSRIIKSSSYVPSRDSVILSVKSPPAPLKTEEKGERLQEISPEVEQAQAEAQMILKDAEESAQSMVDEALRQAQEIRRQAEAEIAAWWEQKQQEAEQLFAQREAEAREQGYAAGFEEGKQVALEEERQTMDAARDILESAYRTKEAIIAEAEPFLVDLSLEIARKVIGEEMSADPENVLQLAKRALGRSRTGGQITLCVNHRFYPYVEEHRGQLLPLLDGQAELMIIPDYTVQDEGCVIRTPLGSVDARIDTQLEEIRQVLMEIARGSGSDERP